MKRRRNMSYLSSKKIDISILEKVLKHKKKMPLSSVEHWYPMHKKNEILKAINESEKLSIQLGEVLYIGKKDTTKKETESPEVKSEPQIKEPEKELEISKEESVLSYEQMVDLIERYNRQIRHAFEEKSKKNSKVDTIIGYFEKRYRIEDKMIPQGRLLKAYSSGDMLVKEILLIEELEHIEWSKLKVEGICPDFEVYLLTEQQDLYIEELDVVTKNGHVLYSNFKKEFALKETDFALLTIEERNGR